MEGCGCGAAALSSRPRRARLARVCRRCWGPIAAGRQGLRREADALARARGRRACRRRPRRPARRSASAIHLAVSFHRRRYGDGGNASVKGGSSMRARAPPPGRLSSVTLPRHGRISSRAIGRPSPVPAAPLARPSREETLEDRLGLPGREPGPGRGRRSASLGDRSTVLPPASTRARSRSGRRARDRGRRARRTQPRLAPRRALSSIARAAAAATAPAAQPRHPEVDPLAGDVALAGPAQEQQLVDRLRQAVELFASRRPARPRPPPCSRAAWPPRSAGEDRSAACAAGATHRRRTRAGCAGAGPAAPSSR